MLEFQYDVVSAQWFTSAGGPEILPMDAPAQLKAVVAPLLKHCLIQTNWARYEIKIPIHSVDQSSVRITWSHGALTVDLIGPLGRPGPTRIRISAAELIQSFSPLLSTEDKVQLTRLCEALSQAPTPPEQAVGRLPQVAQTSLHPWQPIVDPGTFHVAYHEKWTLDRSQETAVDTDGKCVTLSDACGLTVLSLDTGEPLGSHPGLSAVQGGPHRLATSPDGTLACLSTSGPALWRTDEASESPPHLALEMNNTLLVAYPDGSMKCLNALSGRLRWSWRSVTGLPQLVTVHAGRVYTTDSSGLVTVLDSETCRTCGQRRVPGRPIEWLPGDSAPVLLADQPPKTGFALFQIQTDGTWGWRRTFYESPLACSRTQNGAVIAILDDPTRPRLIELCPDTGNIRQHVLLPSTSVTRMHIFQDWIALVSQKGHLHAAPMNAYDPWHMIEPAALAPGMVPQVYDRGDFWVLAHRSVELVAVQSGRHLGQIMNRPCESLIPLPDGDLLIVCDDSVSRFRLGGHLSVVSP